tara:strand:+ start:863 stop:1990 length:1128 start_codon:yes stop_codon:yes gene_type:complete
MSSRIIHTGVGQVSNTNGLGYSFSFATLERSDIQVEVIDPSNNSTTKTVTTHYTIENYSAAGSSNAHIKFVSETARGFTNSQTTYKVKISRQTPSTPKVNFTAGSSITASDLNTQGKQAFHLSEENRDSIVSLAAGDASGAIQISGSNIADNSITTNKILDLEVRTSDLANLAVTTAKIADDAVTADKLANSINTAIAGKADTGANLSTFTNDSNFITLAQVPSQFATGMIMMFTGSSAPSGWAFCDGNNGTPDLRNRFIVGAGSSYSSGDTGGSDSVTLNINQMPQHDHTFSGSHSHSHDLKGVGGNDHNDSTRRAIIVKQDSLTNNVFTDSGGGTTGIQNTTVTISGYTGANGAGGAHENRPPYYALSYIMKL